MKFKSHKSWAFIRNVAIKLTEHQQEETVRFVDRSFGTDLWHLWSACKCVCLCVFVEVDRMAWHGMMGCDGISREHGKLIPARVSLTMTKCTHRMPLTASRHLSDVSGGLTAQMTQPARRETEKERERERCRMGSACSRLSTVFNTLAATTTTSKHNLLRVFVCDVFIFNNTVLHEWA